MKKILSIFLALTLCVGFAGCGEEEVVPKPSSSIASGPSVFDFGAGQNSQDATSTQNSSLASGENNSSGGPANNTGNSGGGYKPSGDNSSTPDTYVDPIPANAPRIICWGDSITAGMGMGGVNDYPSVLQMLIGNKYRVLNAGSSGEQSQTIAARQGAYDVTIDRDLVFKAGYGSVYLDGVNGPNLILTDGTVLDINEDGEAFNNDLPCKKVYINGKEYELAASGKKIQIIREDYKNKLVIKKGTKIVFDSAKKQQGSYCEIFYVGANDGVPEPEKLVARYKAMAKRQGSNRYIVIIPQWDGRYTAALKAEFGDKALDIREEMCKIDPEEFNFTVSSSDKARMRQGKLPLLYMYQNSPNESLHLSAEGYYAMATVIYRHGKSLGYW